jgi:hypothetical protein
VQTHKHTHTNISTHVTYISIHIYIKIQRILHLKCALLLQVNLEDGNTKMTTTKFTASASPHENNVFVIEVQQGGATRSSDNELYLKLSSSAVSSQEDIDEEDSSRRSSSQRAQVHRPPDIDVDEVSDEELEEMDDDEDEDEDTTERNINRDEIFEDHHDGSMKTNTGLSQSDLSISSSGSNNPSYRYGNQVGYEGGHFGYPQYAGYAASDGKAERSADGVKLAVPGRNTTVAIAMKRASSVTEGNDKISNLEMRGRYSIDVTSVNSRLLSDIQAIERRRQQEDDRLQEEQRQLGNGTGPLAVANGDTTTSPVHEKMAEDNQDGIPPLQHPENLSTPLEEIYTGEEQSSGGEDEANPKPETEVDKSAFEVNNEKFDEDGVSEGKKRSSLPVIAPELYTQIKQTTKNLILDKASRPGLSPKFEKFRDENSPLDATEKDVANDASQPTDTTPITSQEYENEAFVSSDQITS